MPENTDIQSLSRLIRDLDQRLDSLADPLRNSGGCGQAKMLLELIEKSRQGLATLRLLACEMADSSASQCQKKEAMQAHAGTVVGFSDQADWIQAAVATWRQNREKSGPDWQIESQQLREQCDRVEGKCDAIAVAVRSRGLRDSNGTAIANYAAQAIEEMFKLRVRMLEFSESPAVNSVQEVVRSLLIFNSDLRQQEEHVNSFLTNRLSEWRREARY